VARAVLGPDPRFEAPPASDLSGQLLSGTRTALIGPVGTGKTATLFELGAQLNLVYLEPTALGRPAGWDAATAALLSGIRSELAKLRAQKGWEPQLKSDEARAIVRAHVAPFLLAHLLLLRRFLNDRCALIGRPRTGEDAAGKLAIEGFRRAHGIDLTVTGVPATLLQEQAKRAIKDLAAGADKVGPPSFMRVLGVAPC
jgi:hypothetical protein